MPSIVLQPKDGAWTAEPTSSRLDRVSNNGLGYTGQIDRYEIVAPATGRLQVSLSWDHDANFDLVLASDDLGELRLADGIENGDAPEYVGIDVVEGQQIFVFVAGWAGDPGPYLLEILLLPPEAPLFGVETIPSFTDPWPADQPMTFTFTTDLDPDQDLDGRVSIAHAGGPADGTWCVDGNTLTFYPHLAQKAGDKKALLPGELHVLTFPRAAAGLRAATGEYLTDLEGIAFYAGPPVDLWPLAPQVTGVTPSPAAPYGGQEITVAISEPLDPAALAPTLVSVATDGTTTPIPFQYQLSQTYLCGGNVEVRLFLFPTAAPPAGTVTRLTLPAGTPALGGGLALNHGLPVTVDFAPP
ncbi:MAG TPA: Ig-like domain-containing protein [Planctomycetota bacterium]|nr:Ig-like domain-containing protein [Planctomycetota bacterium]